MVENRIMGTNVSNMVEMNRSLIVKVLKQKKICSRVELSKITGLTQASITKIVAALIELGIVSEIGLMESQRGRHSIGLQLNGGLYQVIGVKLSRKSFSVGVFDICGNEYTQMTEIINNENCENVIDRIKVAIQDYLNKYNNVVAIGMAVPGPYLREEGQIAFITEFPRWKKVNFKDEFEGSFDKPVFLEHDANSGALAEWWFGNHNPNVNVLVHLLASEGIGAGIISDGNLIIGGQGIAGEIGHISIDVDGEKCQCGNYGCLEKYCSAISMVKRANKLLENYPDSKLNMYTEITYFDIFNEFERGDRFAKELVEYASRYIGYGVVTIINAYNPDLIVISDVMTRGGKFLIDTVKKVVKDRVIPELYEKLDIKLSSFSIDPILYGAAALATDRVLKVPSAFLK